MFFFLVAVVVGVVVCCCLSPSAALQNLSPSASLGVESGVALPRVVYPAAAAPNKTVQCAVRACQCVCVCSCVCACSGEVVRPVIQQFNLVLCASSETT